MKTIASGDWSYEIYPGKSKAGLVLVHEIFGLTDYIRSVAKDLSKQGIWVAAVDLYHGKTETDLEKARKIADAMKDEEILDAMQRALQALKKESKTNLTVGVMGFCMGGAISLQAASHIDYAFCIAYYGPLDEIDQISGIKCPIFMIEGSASERDMTWLQEKFLPAAVKYGKRVEIHLYPNARHAFHNPTGKLHNPEAAKDAWEKTIRFLSQFK